MNTTAATPRFTLRRPLTGLEVRTFRLAMGWSQGDLAAQLGVCKNTISKAEQGNACSVTSTAIYLLWRVAATEAQALGLQRRPPPIPTDDPAAPTNEEVRAAAS